MNYLWELILYAKEHKLDSNQLFFTTSDHPSPYVELSFNSLNLSEFDNQIDMNAYYRFGNVFEKLIGEDLQDYTELKQTLFDILIHFIAYMDVREGLSKFDYYRLTLKKELDQGIYGKEYTNILQLFSFRDQAILSEYIVKLYSIGPSIELFRTTLKRIYQYSMVYFDKVDQKNLLVYIGEKKSKETELKVHLIVDLFVPVDYQIEIFYDMHFGIIGIDETMLINEIAIY